MNRARRLPLPRTFASAALCAAVLAAPVDVGAQRDARAPREADLCVIPPGAQPALPARLLEGMGVTDMAVTTSSEEARKFFNQGVSQLHSFWAIEAERSFLQAATLDPNMAMAWWGISISAAGDHRPAFQLVRDTNDGGRGKALQAGASIARAGTAPRSIPRCAPAKPSSRPARCATR